MTTPPTPFSTRSGALARAAGLHRSGPVLLQSAFRPFFGLAALHAGIVVPVFVVSMLVWPRSPGLPLFLWHAHEMLFGFVGAVLAGFLLTAARVWTGRETVSGALLALLVAVWITGRVLAFFEGHVSSAAAVNLSFLPLVAIAIARPIVLARRWRNLPFPLLLLVLTGTQAVLWGVAAGRLPYEWASRAEWVAIDAVALTIAIIGGRIIPMFTRNALGGASVRPADARDLAAIGGLAVLLVLHLLGIGGNGLDAVLLLVGLLTLLRLWRWRGWRASRVAPFVGVLHWGYALLGLGLMLEAIRPGVGRHVVTLGGIGLLCLAMMARVTLGHTGRPLHPPRGTLAAFWMLIAATLTRALFGLLPAGQSTLLTLSGALWSLAFLVFLVRYGPALVSPRVDGTPG